MSTATKSRKPDYHVAMLDKASERKGNIGAAWKNEDGSISIQLNPFVVIDASQDLLVTLFPADAPFKGKSSGHVPYVPSPDEDCLF